MSKLKVDPRDVQVRFIELQDVEDLVQYFFHSPPGFIESIGLNLAAFGDEDAFRKAWTDGLNQIRERGENPKSYTVLYQGRRIGVHTSTHFQPGESICIHAHFYKPEFRKMGIGTVSGVKAAERMLLDLNLPKVLMKVPVQNAAPLGVLRGLGLTKEKNELLDWPQLKAVMDCEVYSCDLALVQKVKLEFGIE